MVARGARRSKPAVRALYQPFRPLLLSWTGKTGLRTLTGVEGSGDSISLEGTSLACAYYLNELVLRLLGKEQRYELLFAHYALALAELANPNIVDEVVLRSFELRLLDGIGVLPNLSRCTADASAIQADAVYSFHPVNAVAVAQNAEDDSGLNQASSRLKGETPESLFHPDGVTPDTPIEVSGSTLIALSQFELNDPNVVAEAKPFMRQLLKLQLGDQPLKSRELYQALTPGSDHGN